MVEDNKKEKKIVMAVVDDSFDEKGFVIKDAQFLETMAKKEGTEVIMIPNLARYNYFKEKDREHLEKDKNYDYHYVLAIGDTRKMGLDSHQVRKDLRHLMQDRHSFIIFPYSDVNVDYHINHDSILNSEEHEYAREMLPKYKRAEKYLNMLKKSSAYKRAKGPSKQPYHFYSPFRARVEEKQDKKSEKLEDLIVRDQEVNNPENFN